MHYNSLVPCELPVYVDIPDGAIIRSVIAKHATALGASDALNHTWVITVSESMTLRDPILGNSTSDKAVFYV